jgi:hypothetical protein
VATGATPTRILLKAAAADRDALIGDVTALLGTEEQDGIGDVFWLGK